MHAHLVVGPQVCVCVHLIAWSVGDTRMIRDPSMHKLSLIYCFQAASAQIFNVFGIQET